MRPEEFWNEYTLVEINEMLAAAVLKEERNADNIAYAVSLAWGGKRKKGSQGARDAKTDREHLRALMRGESDGSPIPLDSDAVETIFPESKTGSELPYIPPPSTEPHVDVEADKAYLLELDRVFEEHKKRKEN